MSGSSFDYITSQALGVLEKFFPESSTRQRRIQDLIIEIEEMEKSVSVLEFGTYFDRVVEIKDLLLEELVSLCTTLRKQDVELERLNVVVTEKNKAISTLASENETEKEAFNSAQNELKALREKVAEMEQQGRRYEALVLRLRKSDSAREEDMEVVPNCQS